MLDERKKVNSKIHQGPGAPRVEVVMALMLKRIFYENRIGLQYHD
jgi:hypothetical protein